MLMLFVDFIHEKAFKIEKYIKKISLKFKYFSKNNKSLNKHYAKTTKLLLWKNIVYKYLIRTV